MYSVVKHKFLLVALLFVAVSLPSDAHTPAEWTRRTIYQIMTDRFAGSSSETWSACEDLSKYCGGTYIGLTEKLDYVAGMGFDAIWISPIPQNMGDDYHGYCFQDLYQLNPNFGSREDLLNFISEAHKRDIWVMLDVVANHVAPVDLSFELINPFNESMYYHNKCDIIDWDNQEEVEYCRLANLPDLDQNNTFVRNTLIEWIGSLKDTYGFDGYRIDTVPHVHPDFWTEYNKAADSYCVGEVFNGDLTYVSDYQQYVDGLLHYPLYYALRDVFISQQSMQRLEDSIGPNGSFANAFQDVKTLGVFVDNHDNSRFLYSQADQALYQNALVAVLLTQGIPIIYYGSEQAYHGGNDPQNRESLWPNYNADHTLYKLIAAVNDVRKSYAVPSQPQVQRYAAEQFYAFTRGEVLVCLTNAGSNINNSNSSSSSVTVNITFLPYSVGTRLCNVLVLEQGQDDCVVVGESGDGITVVMTGGLPKVYVSSSSLSQAI